MRRAILAGFLTALLAGAGLWFRADTAVLAPSRSPGAVPYAPAFRGLTRGPAALMTAHDGQAFGSLALDPLLTHPERWAGKDGRAQMAYRASRPLLGWLVMATSFGSASAAAWSLVAWTAIGIGVLAAGAFALARAWRREADWVPLLLFLPAVVGQVAFPGLSDALATGLALIGLALWTQGRDRFAVVAFCLAALSRETTLLVPAALLLTTPFRRGRRLLLPVLAYGAWVGVVWLRLGALPSQARQSRLGLPFVGLVNALVQWSWVGTLSAASVAILGGVALWRAPTRAVRLLVALSAALSVTMPYEVWRSWDFARVLLPVTVVGACLLGRRSEDASQGPEADGRSIPGDVVAAL